MKQNTSILYSGKSEYTNNPIEAYITLKSANIKTGNIPQISIMPKGIKPTDSIKTGQDKDVCGGCPLRPILFDPKKNDSPCYVNCGFAPNAINRAKNKPQYNYEDFFDVIRIGSWGDSASIKKPSLLKIVRLSKRVLNYTHAWHLKKFSFLKSFSMASVHSIEEKNKANLLGFRTFRTVKPIPFADHLKHFKNAKHVVNDIQKNEIVCPNFVNNAIQCKMCKLCCGDQIKSKVDIVIPSH